MARQVNERLVAQGGLRIPASAASGSLAVSDASGNVSWSTASAAGLEQSANKGAASGYMGLDGSSRGAQSPKLHHADHSKGGADAVALSSIATAMTDVPQALIDGMLPWTIGIVPMFSPTDAVIVQGTLSSGTSASAGFLNGQIWNSSNAQNDEYGWDLSLAAGTWKLSLMFVGDPTRAIATFNLDGVSVGTIDQYRSTTAVWNASGSITAFTVAANGKHRLTLKAATRNASATGWFMSVQQIQLRRTA